MASIGQGIDRVDGRLKVTGRARYAAEFAVPDVVHAVLVQSTIGAGAITGFDLAAAQAMPGVLAIITPDNAPKLPMKGGSQQIGACAAAAGPGRSTSTASMSRSSWRRHAGAGAMPPPRWCACAIGATSRSRRWMRCSAQAYPPKNFRNGERPPDSRRGDPDAAFDGAAAKVDATYITPMEHHNPMEPHATIARWDGNRLTVWTATQGISGAQQTLAALFGIDAGECARDLPLCRRRLWLQGQHLAAGDARRDGGEGGRPAGEARGDARADVHARTAIARAPCRSCASPRTNRASLVSMRHDGFSQMSQPALGEFCRTGRAGDRDAVCLPERGGDASAGGDALRALPTYMRAPGLASGNFALESAIDELAVALKMDPLEFRLRNYAEQDPHQNKPFASKALRECYRQGAEAFGWSRRSPEPRSMRDGNVLIGWGMATSTYPTHRMPASARVRVGANGTALVQVGHAGPRHRHLHGDVADRRR